MATSLRDIAIDIWKAGVAAVGSERLIRQNVSISGKALRVVDQSFDLGQLGRVVVVGAGKAGAGMAAAVETVFTEAGLADRLAGWVNVPADCVRPLSRITLHAARPAGVNEPTAEGVAGAERILELVSGLRDDDLCLAAAHRRHVELLARLIGLTRVTVTRALGKLQKRGVVVKRDGKIVLVSRSHEN